MEINEKNELPHNTLIKFDCKNGITGTGVIKGIATNGVPILGRAYIIEVLSSINISLDEYPYSHMVVFENFIELVTCK